MSALNITVATMAELQARCHADGLTYTLAQDCGDGGPLWRDGEVVGAWELISEPFAHTLDLRNWRRLPEVDAFARRNQCNRSEAIRLLVNAGLSHQ